MKEEILNSVFTETPDGMNASVNQLEVTCITSKQNKFHLDSEGNLSVNSITTVVDNGTSGSANIDFDSIYPIGSIYMNVSLVDPTELFGGTWELQRTFYGGELIAYGTAIAQSGSTVNKDELVAFSDVKVGKKKYEVENYVEGILEGISGTILVHTKGIVGLIETQMVISGLGGAGNVGMWFDTNSNPLPEGVTESPVTNKPLLTGPIPSSYGGTTNTYFYKVATDKDVMFYTNPTFKPYAGPMTVSTGGVTSKLMVKAYAKPGTSYMWKRVA